MAENATPAAPTGGRRQTRAPGGRRHKTTVKMTDAEFEQLGARAAAAGLSLPAWLVAAGLADRSGEPGLSRVSMSGPERRAWASEFVAARRLLRGVATNVNQLAAGFNATGEVGEQLGVVLAATLRVSARLEELTDRLAGRAPVEPAAGVQARPGARPVRLRKAST